MYLYFFWWLIYVFNVNLVNFELLVLFNCKKIIYYFLLENIIREKKYKYLICK